MPISKKGVKYYTKEQLEHAKEISALEYAQANNYNLVRQGARFILREHDSMVFHPDGRWHWNSKGVGGRALDLLVHYEGYSLVDAVLQLAGDSGGFTTLPCPRHTEIKPVAEIPFVLPPRSATQKHLFAYLCGCRKMDGDIVRELIHQRRLYESVHHYKSEGSSSWRECYNVVFLGVDAAGVAHSAYQRGANSKSTFKSEVPGSKKLEHPFVLSGQPWSKDVGFFEASIDAISHATLYKQRGVDYKVMERVAMGGIVAETAATYLAQHPEKRHIHFCLDGDEAGNSGAIRIEDLLRKRGYDEISGYTYATESIPAGKKDWNEYLISVAP